MHVVALKNEKNEEFPFDLTTYYPEDSNYLIKLIRYHSQIGYFTGTIINSGQMILQRSAYNDDLIKNGYGK